MNTSMRRLAPLTTEHPGHHSWAVQSPLPRCAPVPVAELVLPGSDGTPNATADAPLSRAVASTDAVERSARIFASA
jgi:hypothetical protein